MTYVITRPLTAEISNPKSPVRQFLDERFTTGLRDIQRQYRATAGPLSVPGVPREDANPGTIGTATDWLLRFLLCPQPDLHLALLGANLADGCGAGIADAACQLTRRLGADPGRHVAHLAVWPGYSTFTGPAAGCTLDPELLARSCWVLALLTEVFRGGPMVAAQGPLARFVDGQDATVDDLLSLAPPAALSQLSSFRGVFEADLIPHLTSREGAWALGPVFTGSALMNADADLIAAGLLIDLKTSVKLSLAVTDLFQVIGYALLDFDDEFSLDTVGIFSARYAYLATWPLIPLLDELAGHEVSLAGTRAAFRDLLIKHATPNRRGPTAPMACEHPLHLSPGLIAEAGKPFSHPGDNTIPGQVFCEVQRGHDGPHLAQIQAFGDDEAWAQWAVGSPAAVRYFSGETLCEAKGRAVDDGEDDVLCALPARHHGEHTFSLRHVHSEGRDPSPEHAAKLAQIIEDTEA